MISGISLWKDTCLLDTTYYINVLVLYVRLYIYNIYNLYILYIRTYEMLYVILRSGKSWTIASHSYPDSNLTPNPD